MHAYAADALFDARAGTLIDDAVVLVDESGSVVAAGPRAQTGLGDAEVREVSGVLLPGLIDMHTHICLSAGPNPGADALRDHPAKIALRAARNLGRHLDAGITTIRDVGGQHGIDLELARLVAAGDVEGPDVFAAGNVIAMTGGHACFLGVECDSPAEVRKAARENIKAGAGVIKLIATGGVITEGVQPGAPQLTEEEMRAGCEEAHKASKRVAAHAQGTEGIENALRAGVDTIEHGFWLSDFAISFMVQEDRSLVPTFAALYAMERDRESLPAFIREKLDLVAGPQKRSFAAAREAGVRFVTGTDAGTPGNEHGDIKTELCALLDNDVPVVDAWRAATLWACEALGRDDRGVLEVGRRADLIALPREAFDDPRRLLRPHLVVKAGRALREGEPCLD
jgi:imidazolonepropionase-like amidohydrolase